MDWIVCPKHEWQPSQGGDQRLHNCVCGDKNYVLFK